MVRLSVKLDSAPPLVTALLPVKTQEESVITALVFCIAPPLVFALLLLKVQLLNVSLMLNVLPLLKTQPH